MGLAPSHTPDRPTSITERMAKWVRESCRENLPCGIPDCGDIAELAASDDLPPVLCFAPPTLQPLRLDTASTTNVAMAGKVYELGTVM